MRLVTFAASAFCALAALGIIPIGHLLFTTSASPGLATLAAFAAALGVMALLIGVIGVYTLRSPRGPFMWSMSADANIRLGLDILAVLGGAVFVVWLGNALA